MSHYIQYHNYQKLKVLPRHDPPFLEGKGYISTTVRTVKGAVGDTAFLILGIGKPKRTFFLWECFEIEDVASKNVYVAEKQKTIEAFTATGTGWQFIPPARLEGEDFDTFRRACADFVRFRSVDDPPIFRNSSRYRISTDGKTERRRRKTYNKELEDFCATLIDLAVDDGETYYNRGLVRQHLGKDSLARQDFGEAVTLLTSLIENIEQYIPVGERDLEIMARLQFYRDQSKAGVLACRNSAAR